MKRKKEDIAILAKQNDIENILDEEDINAFRSMIPELRDSWTKKQIYRTEVEMRASVLNDGKFPTRASKYWQAVREQSVFFENLMGSTFDYRKNEIKIKQLQKRIKNSNNELDKEMAQIELEESLFARANMELVAKDRIRELKLWSKILKELDDGSFNKQDPGADQLEALRKRLAYKAKLLSKNSTSTDAFNILSVLKTATSLKKESLKAIKNDKKVLKDKQTKLEKLLVTKTKKKKKNVSGT